MDTQSANKDYRRMIFVFLGIIALVVVGIWGWEIYDQSQLPRKMAEIQRQGELEREQIVAKLMKDTYGGKTPQKTLQMYIDAVEKGDYELASKYFIEKYRDKELRNLQLAKEKNNLESIISDLKISIKDPGSYSDDGRGFLVSDPLLVDFTLYPNGIWKILQI